MSATARPRGAKSSGRFRGERLRAGAGGEHRARPRSPLSPLSPLSALSHPPALSPRPPPALGTDTPRSSSKASALGRPGTAGRALRDLRPAGTGDAGRARAARRERSEAPAGGPDIAPSAAPVPRGGGRTHRGGVAGCYRCHGAGSAAPGGKSPRRADGRRPAGTSRLSPPATPHLSRGAAGPGGGGSP